MSDSPWKTVLSTIVYESPWMKLRHDQVVLPDGSLGEFDVLERKDFVVVIAFKDQQLYLVDQYRYPINRRSLEFIEGSMEAKEEPLEAAKRELVEEAGLVSDSWNYLDFLYLANGNQTQKFHIFVARDCTQQDHSRDPGEKDMVVKITTTEEFTQLIIDGKVKDSPTVAAWNIYLLKKEDHGH